MLTRPFQLPLIKKSTIEQTESRQKQDGPLTKKRRISLDPKDTHRPLLIRSDHNNVTINRTSVSQWASRTVLQEQDDLNANATYKLQCHEVCYHVLWRNFKIKKHRTWDGDGILSVGNGHATLKDSDGKELGRTLCKIPLFPEALLSVGAKEVQIEALIRNTDHPSGISSHIAQKKHAMTPNGDGLKLTSQSNLFAKIGIQEDVRSNGLVNRILPSTNNPKFAFKVPLKESTITQKCDGAIPVPRHDPNMPGALVMRRLAHNLSTAQIVDVVVDPVLSKNLREHQRAGVQFLYECVMGMRPFSGDGAILADEMGLGKTLQVITLLWTLMKQNPVYGDPPVVKKALVVCPVTLIKNWKKEFRKWLGLERVGVFVLEDKKSRLSDFTVGKSYNIMIIGYEKLRTVLPDLQKRDCIDIVIADEGHRLKTAQNKSALAIKSLSTSRKIILSGTPLQNDLSEFYFMVDFVNPGLLGKVNSFKKEFEVPILRSRQPGASLNDIEKGDERNKELTNLTSLFILRRTAELLTKYLPQKTEYVLFCCPTSSQASIYRNLLSSSVFSTALSTPEASLQLIDILKKLCNSPSLLLSRAQSDEIYRDATTPSLLSSIPANLLNAPGASGKLQVLDSLLYHIRNTTDEKVVIVSHYTATLDILEKLLCALDYGFLRLDGSTSQSKRQDLVDKFNRTDANTCFVFLLSAKSGGMGLNLTGASRLLLFDCSWNPSTDLQAMARIHRDGQHRPCMIYRLLTKGALDEKIYQRQQTKLSLADSVVDNKVSASSFTKEELRDLFRLDEREECQTHELLGCQCGGNGMIHNSGAPTPFDNDIDVDQRQGGGQSDEFGGFSLSVDLSEFQTNGEESAIATTDRSAKARMQMTLMRYQHFSTAKLLEDLTSEKYLFTAVPRKEGSSKVLGFSSEETRVMLQDEALMGMLKEPENRVSFVFARTSS